MEAYVPIIPIVIRVPRSIIRAGSWLPRHHPISISIGEPIYPDESAKWDPWRSATALRDDVRNPMLAEMGEPDLNDEKTARPS